MDIRQTRQWGQYLSQIGWIVENVDKVQIYIRKIPFLNSAVVKIQHPKNPLPFQRLDDLAKKYHALCLMIEPEIEGYSQILFKKNGYQRSNMYLTHTATVQLNLKQSGDRLFTSFSENARRNIKKAQKNGVYTKTVFLKGEGDNQFKKFYDLLKTLSVIKRFWIPDYEEFYKKMLAFKRSSFLQFAYHKNDQQPIAVVWVAYFNKKAVYMHAGINKTGYQFLANYLLVWDALKILKKMGMEIFDFEGIYDPRFPKEKKRWQQFSEFKKRFHGKLVEYPPPYIKCYNIFFKLLFLCSRILSRS